MEKKSKWALENKGFTLVELAIVLVIIGIIIGAVLKGQDLIEGARGKKVTAQTKQFETLAWAYYDRKGRFPGDGTGPGNATGVIGSNSGNPNTDMTGVSFVNAPTTNTLAVGATTLYYYLGNDGQTKAKNVIIICRSADCATTMGSDEITYFEAVDTAIDGASDATGGKVMGFTGTASANSGTWLATLTYASASFTTAWGTSTKALVYYFDKKQ